MTSGTTHLLDGVWGSSSSDVFAVGFWGTILHYDGSAWSPMTSGASNPLLGVWGNSSSDVFALGDWGLILHYDGSAWSPSQMSGHSTSTLEGVWGSSSSDAFAVGWHGTILHYGAQGEGGPSWAVIAGIAVGSVAVAVGIFFAIRKWVWKKGVPG
jgi:hypothetical protein